MAITSTQFRMARAALMWTVRELAEKAGVHFNTISRIESGDAIRGHAQTAVRRALEEAGVEFIEAVEGVHGPAVALKWGMPEPTRRSAVAEGSEDLSGRSPGASGSALEDPERQALAEYLDANDLWSELSEVSRCALRSHLAAEATLR
jgi:transcriptional regulator with XRE-family HTH domain